MIDNNERTNTQLSESQIKAHYTESDYAKLQALGIQIYQPISAINVASMPWITKLAELLDISESDCSFDNTQIAFDSQSRKLHLPKTSYLSESQLKKAIWQAIRPHVNQYN